jgi:signal transduction histidine kinase
MKTLQQLEVTFRFNQGLEEKLSNDQKIMIYRIIQEQTNNIIKYAAARSVQILINESRENVRLIVGDDGKGFDPSQKPKGIGFTNIFNRADAYNGKVNIISSPGNGCILELQFPL